MARLLELAATKKPLMLGAVSLSALASIVSFIPYIAICFIVREVLSIWPDTAALKTSLLYRYGWYAFRGTVANTFAAYL